MKIVDFSLKKRVTMSMVVLVIVILGMISFTKLGLDMLPDMDYPYITVITTYGGVSSEDIEQNITRPVEQWISTVSGIKNLDIGLAGGAIGRHGGVRVGDQPRLRRPGRARHHRHVFAIPSRRGRRALRHEVQLLADADHRLRHHRRRRHEPEQAARLHRQRGRHPPGAHRGRGLDRGVFARDGRGAGQHRQGQARIARPEHRPGGSRPSRPRTSTCPPAT